MTSFMECMLITQQQEQWAAQHIIHHSTFARTNKAAVKGAHLLMALSCPSIYLVLPMPWQLFFPGERHGNALAKGLWQISRPHTQPQTASHSPGPASLGPPLKRKGHNWPEANSQVMPECVPQPVRPPGWRQQTNTGKYYRTFSNS